MRLFERTSFRHRMIIALGVTALLLAIIAAIRVVVLVNLQGDFDQVQDRREALALIQSAQVSAVQEANTVQQYLTTNDDGLAEVSRLANRTAQNAVRSAQNVAADDQPIITTVGTDLAALGATREQILLANDQDQATTLFKSQYAPLSNQILQELALLERNQRSSIEETESSYLNTLQRSIGQRLLLIILPVILIVVVGIFLLISITRPLHQLVVLAKQVADGDFTGRSTITSNDELGELATAFNAMSDLIQESQTRLQGEVDVTTRQLSETLEQVAEQNTRLSRTQKAVINVLSDVEDEKKNVENEKTKVELIIENIADGVVIIDHSRGISLLNKAARDMLQLEPVEAFGMQIEELIDLYDANDEHQIETEQFIGYLSMHDHQADDLPAGEDEEDHIYVIHRPDKSRFTARMTATPLIINDQVASVIIVFRDITREQIIDRQKTEFISVASHQLRTPLSSIKWFLEMVINGDAGDINEEQADFLNEAYRSNERMIVLVGDLLNVSRIEQGRVGVEPEPTNVTELVEDIIQELRHSYQEKQQQFTFTKGAHLPEAINVDPKLVRQAIHNLLTNAIKYTPEQGQVTVTLQREENDIHFSVHDTGYGIPEDAQSSIFQKFFRAGNVVSKDTEGNGLGMYVTKSVIESSGGEVWFESKEGEGSTFHVTLPVEGSKAKSGEVSLLGATQ